MLNTTADALTDYKGFVPCTALACIKALDSISQDITGKNVVIVNRSNLVGRPLSALLLQKNATVSICHSFTKNIADIMQNADIVICAIGKSRFFNKTYFKQNAIIIDVGISRNFENGKNILCGDVDFDSLIGHARYITPVPGGIGPITVACLLSNVVKAFEFSQQIRCEY
jgi:methylenetetrahydrofolate dehydrogenase (NADP+)/methenyltetrahydrofolate cyclohydrolase